MILSGVSPAPLGPRRRLPLRRRASSSCQHAQTQSTQEQLLELRWLPGFDFRRLRGVSVVGRSGGSGLIVPQRFVDQRLQKTRSADHLLPTACASRHQCSNWPMAMRLSIRTQGHDMWAGGRHGEWRGLISQGRGQGGHFFPWSRCLRIRWRRVVRRIILRLPSGRRLNHPSRPRKVGSPQKPVPALAPPQRGLSRGWTDWNFRSRGVVL